MFDSFGTDGTIYMKRSVTTFKTTNRITCFLFPSLVDLFPITMEYGITAKCDSYNSIGVVKAEDQKLTDVTLGYYDSPVAFDTSDLFTHFDGCPITC